MNTVDRLLMLTGTIHTSNTNEVSLLLQKMSNEDVHQFLKNAFVHKVIPQIFKNFNESVITTDNGKRNLGKYC